VGRRRRLCVSQHYFYRKERVNGNALALAMNVRLVRMREVGELGAQSGEVLDVFMDEGGLENSGRDDW
jgi:hypothetical protein